MLFFENDYCEGAHPAILQRLLETRGDSKHIQGRNFPFT